MTVFHAPRTWNVGELVTKAMLDEQIRDNLNAIWVGTAAGDIDYYSSATTKSKLAKPSVASLLAMDSSGVPSWLAITSVGGLHAKGTVDFAPGGQTFSGAWADITGATLDLVLTATCTIIVLAQVVGYNNTAGNAFLVRAVVNGAADPATNLPFNGGASIARNENLSYEYYAINVPAGTRTVKLQCEQQGTNNVVERGRLIALAFTE